MPRLTTLSRLAAAAATAALLLTACSSGGDGKTYSFSSWTKDGALISSADRKPAADVSGTLLSGGKTSLAAYRGKVVLVTFWGQWCGPCTVETPQYAILYRKLEGDDFTVLGIDTKDEAGKAKTFVADNRISFPNIYDFDGENLLKLGNLPGSLPITVLVDKQGRVAAAYAGGQAVKTVEPAVRRLIAEKT